MAKEELLRFLRQGLLMLFMLSSQSIYAGINQDETLWAQDIASMAMSSVDLAPNMDQQKQRPNLQIFVSSTMPESVLSNLAREASKYDGVLVFRGLPQGSMMELSNLVMRISEKDHPAAMQVDDEAFRLHGIKQVPSFVLSQTKSDLSGVVDSTLGNFICVDKMVGNVMLSFVLDEFVKSGDCRELAARLLQMDGR